MECSSRMANPRTPDETAARSVSDALDRIAALNATLNAFISVFAADAMQQAHVLDDELRQGRSRGPLHGKTISIKDLIDVKGAATTAGSRVRDGHVANSDATVVGRLRDAGAIIIGKTNLHEFALGTTSDESASGPVHNPHDARRSPGGSSGGSAAAVAAGMGWGSIGTDTGGSIRIPAAACGVVGLKPSFGEVPTVGVIPLSVSLDHVGPIAQTVADVWAIYDALVGRPTLPPVPPPPIAGVRIGKLTGYFLDTLDDEVRARFEEALRRLDDAGVTIVDMELAGVPSIATTYINVALTEAFAYHAKALEKAPEAFGENVRNRLQMGATISRDDYVQAQADRVQLRAAVDKALSRCDVLALPTLPIPAQPIGASTVIVADREELLRPLMLRLTQLFNLTGHPAISLPCAKTRDGLPCGFQMAGRRQQTPALLQIALSCEAFVTPREPSYSPPR